MEIELNGLTSEKLRNPLALLTACLALALVFGWIGYRHTPNTQEGAPAILTWSEWRILLAEQAYQAELTHMQQEADRLANALNSQPDPVRAQIQAERISGQYQEGEPALDYQREKLISAAAAVQDWGAGVLTRDQAIAIVSEAVDALQSLGENR